MYTVNECTICPYRDCSTKEKMDKKEILNAALGVRSRPHLSMHFFFPKMNGNRWKGKTSAGCPRIYC